MLAAEAAAMAGMLAWCVVKWKSLWIRLNLHLSAYDSDWKIRRIDGDLRNKSVQKYMRENSCHFLSRGKPGRVENQGVLADLNLGFAHR